MSYFSSTVRKSRYISLSDTICCLLFFFLLWCNSTLAQYGPTRESEYSKDFSRAIKVMETENYRMAIIVMDGFIDKYPQNAPMYYNRAMSKFNLNDMKGAEADFILCKDQGFEERARIIDWWSDKAYRVRMLTQNLTDSRSLLESRGFRPLYSLKDSLRGALRQERNCYDVFYYDLSVRVDPRRKNIEGSNTIHFTVTEESQEIQIDLAEELSIASIMHAGEELSFRRVHDAVFVRFDEKLPIGSKQIVKVVYSGKPRVAPNPPWNGGFVWSKSKGKPWVGVACEHLGASIWWPCKDHLTEEPDSMTINIQSPSDLKAIANGNLRSVRVVDEKYTNYEWFVSYPINSYNVTFYIGNFVNFNETYSHLGNEYQLDYYVLPHNLDKAKMYYSQTKDILRVFEKLFGPYPYLKDGVGMVEAPYKGMEHQGAIAIGDEYPNVISSDPSCQTFQYDRLLVHETAHEWWGNTVTMSDMADTWISEGFATYSEHLFLEQMLGYETYLEASSVNMHHIHNIWPLVGQRDVNENTSIGNDIYTKGAATLHSFRCVLDNDSLFLGLIKGFYNTYKLKQITTSDFIAYANAYTKRDYTAFFEKFLYSSEPPTLEYSYAVLNDSIHFICKWVGVKDGFVMPISLTTSDGSNHRLMVTTDRQTFIKKGTDFFLVNEHRRKRGKVTPNSFTYYWTSWLH